MTVIVEPGVTFEQLKAHLDEHHPDLAYTYPFAPPFTSVLMNALLDGLNNLSLPGGAMGRWLTGVEAVLADGTVVRTGTGGVVDGWFARAPLPDLTGPVRVDAGHHRHRAARRPRARAQGGRTAAAGSRSAGRSTTPTARCGRWPAPGSVDDVGCMTWPSAKLLFGATRDLVRADDEPMAFLFIDLTGASAAELAARRDLARAILADAGVDPPFEVSHLVELMPGMAKLAELPTTLDFLLDFPGGGLAWVGLLRPARRVGGRRRGRARRARAPRVPAVPRGPPDGGRPLPRAPLRGLLRPGRRRGGRPRAGRAWASWPTSSSTTATCPYKASADAARRIVERADPGFGSRCSRRVRDALDPERRMNPGRWPGT